MSPYQAGDNLPCMQPLTAIVQLALFVGIALVPAAVGIRALVRYRADLDRRRVQWLRDLLDSARLAADRLPCQHCGARIWVKDGVYVDGTGGDVCCADKFTENNENGSHRPL